MLFRSHLQKYSDASLCTFLKHVLQRLQPRVLGMTLQALHTCIWGISPILFSADPLKLCQVGWGVLLHSYFQVSPEMFDHVQVGALARSLKDIQRLVPKLHLCCLGCVLRVVVLLEESEPSPQSEVLSALEQVFIKDLCTLLHSFLPRS